MPRVQRFLLVLLLWLLPAHSARAEWSQPMRMNPTGTEGWFPKVATDLSGRAHVVWSSGPSRTAADSVLYCSPTEQGCTAAVRLVQRPAPEGAYVTRPSPAVDRTGTFHLFWRQKMVLVYTATPVMEVEAAREWTRARKLGEGSYTALTIDESGSLHAVWSQPIFKVWGGPCDPNPCYGCADVFYSRSDDGGVTWTLGINIADTPDGSEKPRIVVAKDGTIFVVWEEGADHYVGRGKRIGSMLRASRDGGHTWDELVRFNSPDDAPQTIEVGIDGNNRVVVVWQQVIGEGIFFQTSDDAARTWSAPQQISGVLRRALVNKLDEYDLAADSQGHLHLVLSGRLAEEPTLNHVLHLEWDGEQWAAPESIFSTDGTPEWTHIAVGNGNQLHAVWFERPAGFEWRSDGMKYTVWYAHGTTNAPAVAPIAFPAVQRPLLTTTEMFRLAQGMLAISVVGAVIVATRRRGW